MGKTKAQHLCILIAVDNGRPQVPASLILCLRWAACANACGTNRGWRPFCRLCRADRFDVRIWPHFHVKTHNFLLFTKHIGMSPALFNLWFLLLEVIMKDKGVRSFDPRLSLLCQVGDDVIRPCKVCGGCQIRVQRSIHSTPICIRSAFFLRRTQLSRGVPLLLRQSA